MKLSVKKGLEIMKSKDILRKLKNLEAPAISIDRIELRKRRTEYCFLYRNVYSTWSVPDINLPVTSCGKRVYVDRLRYIDFLEDLALLRYKFSRKKYKGVKSHDT